MKILNFYISLHGKNTYNSSPSSPAIIISSILYHLYDIELVIIVANVSLVQHAVKVIMDLANRNENGSIFHEAFFTT